VDARNFHRPGRQPARAGARGERGRRHRLAARDLPRRGQTGRTRSRRRLERSPCRRDRRYHAEQPPGGAGGGPLRQSGGGSAGPMGRSEGRRLGEWHRQLHGQLGGGADVVDARDQHRGGRAGGRSDRAWAPGGAFRRHSRPGPAASAAASGAPIEGTVGTALGDPLAVRVSDRYGNPLAGVQVLWIVARGGGFVSPAASLTDSSGVARTSWTLGTSTRGGAQANA
jgi:hypothetical protein